MMNQENLINCTIMDIFFFGNWKGAGPNKTIFILFFPFHLILKRMYSPYHLATFTGQTCLMNGENGKLENFALERRYLSICRSMKWHTTYFANFVTTIMGLFPPLSLIHTYL